MSGPAVDSAVVLAAAADAPVLKLFSVVLDVLSGSSGAVDKLDCWLSPREGELGMN